MVHGAMLSVCCATSELSVQFISTSTTLITTYNFNELLDKTSSVTSNKLLFKTIFLQELKFTKAQEG